MTIENPESAAYMTADATFGSRVSDGLYIEKEAPTEEGEAAQEESAKPEVQADASAVAKEESEAAEEKAPEADTKESDEKATEADASEEKTELDKLEDALFSSEDIVGFEKEYVEKGELTKETRSKIEAKLGKLGIPADYIDDVIASRQAKADAFDNAVFEAIGGKEASADIMKWAGENLPPEQCDAFNRAMASGDQAGAVLAATAVRASYDQARSGTDGFAARRIVEGGPGAGTGAGFASEAEFNAAVRDPRYKSDELHRADVDAKALRSAWFRAQVQAGSR